MSDLSKLNVSPLPPVVGIQSSPKERIFRVTRTRMARVHEAKWVWAQDNLTAIAKAKQSHLDWWQAGDVNERNVLYEASEQ